MRWGYALLASMATLCGCSTLDLGQTSSTAAPRAAVELTPAAAAPARQHSVERPQETHVTLVPSPADSLLLIYARRGGQLANLGHNHVIAARSFEGEIFLTDAVVGSRFALRIALSGLTVDEPALRRAAGPDFESEPSESDIAATRANMLSPDGLDAERFTHVRLEGLVSARRADKVDASIELSVRGVTQRVQVRDALLDLDGTRLRLRGGFSLRQSDFGITPFSVLGGALEVLDTVTLVFDLRARPAT